MRDYAKISPSFWTGTTGKELRRRGPEAVIVGVYLMTSPHSNMLGLFYQPELYMAHETGLGFEGALKGLQGCIEAGFCKYDAATEMVWVMEMAGYQIADELKATDKRCSGIQKDYDALPNNPFLAAFFDRYQAAFHLTRKRAFEAIEQNPIGGASEPHRSKEKEKEKEQEKETPIAPKGVEARFEEFWKAYPRKVGKDAAQKAFAKRKPDEKLTAEMLVALASQCQGERWTKDGGQFIPHPATWLNEGRWKDEEQSGVVVAGLFRERGL